MLITEGKRISLAAIEIPVALTDLEVGPSEILVVESCCQASRHTCDEGNTRLAE